MQRLISAALAVALAACPAIAQPPAAPAKPSKPPTAEPKAAAGPNIRPSFDLTRRTAYSLKIKGTYSEQSSSGLLSIPVELSLDLRVTPQVVPTDKTDGELDVEVVAVRYFANEKTGNLTYDSAKPPRSKPSTQDRSKQGFDEASQHAADERFKRVTGSHVRMFVNAAGRVTRIDGADDLPESMVMAPFIPPTRYALTLLAGVAGTNTDPEFAGVVRDRMRWTVEKKSGSAKMPYVLEFGYEVRVAAQTKVEIVYQGHLKLDDAPKNQIALTVEPQGAVVWDPKAGQLINTKFLYSSAITESTNLGTRRRTEKWETTLQRGATDAAPNKPAAPATPVAPPAAPANEDPKGE